MAKIKSSSMHSMQTPVRVWLLLLVLVAVSIAGFVIARARSSQNTLGRATSRPPAIKPTQDFPALSTSDDVLSLEKELSATSFSSLDLDLTELEKELR